MTDENDIDAVLAAWIADASAALGLPEAELSDDDRAALLDLAKVAAHSVARPAAPLTTFLAGYAAGVNGDLQEAIAALSGLAARWSPPER